MGADDGFRIVDERTLHTGYSFRLTSVTVEAPDGHTFQRDVVRHVGAVGVVPLHDDGTVTLVRQYRAPVDASLLEIPAGLRDVDGEDPAITASRELAEEVGLAADSYELLTVFHNAAGLSDERLWVYLATGLRQVDMDRQGTEEAHMTMERLPLSDVVAMVENGTITDVKTVVGALLAARRR